MNEAPKPATSGRERRPDEEVAMPRTCESNTPGAEDGARAAFAWIGAAAVRDSIGFAVLCALLLLLTASGAQAQGINPEGGAQKIFNLIGLFGLLGGIIVGIGSLMNRRVLSGFGFLLAGGIVWVCCKDPEGTIGSAAEWVVQQFQ